MRKAYLSVGALAVAATVVFFVAYFSGRRPSLEQEMERLRRPRAAVPAKSQGIPSLRQPEAPPAPEPPPAGSLAGAQEIGEGVSVARGPVEQPGILLVLDTAALAAAPALRDELGRFFAHPPAAGRIGLRALAGATPECGVTGAIRECGPWSAEELDASLTAALGVAAGPRNPARALAEAVRDLGEVAGPRAIVVVAGGGDECGVDLCASPPETGGDAVPVHVLLLEAGTAAPAEPEGTRFDTPPAAHPWTAGYRCVAERSGGSLLRVAGAGELERRLRAIAQGIESAVTVRATHGADAEVQGASPEGASAWGATLVAPGGDGRDGAVRASPVLPATFAVPGGTWEARCRYAGIERTAAVAVAPGEHAEVRFSFATGELYVEARDAAGGEIVGDSGGFGCAWGAAALIEEGEAPVAETCTLPARFELPEGDYRVRVRWKGREEALTGVTVERGESAVRSVDFSAVNP